MALPSLNLDGAAWAAAVSHRRRARRPQATSSMATKGFGSVAVPIRPPPQWRRADLPGTWALLGDNWGNLWMNSKYCCLGWRRLPCTWLGAELAWRQPGSFSVGQPGLFAFAGWGEESQLGRAPRFSPWGSVGRLNASVERFALQETHQSQQNTEAETLFCYMRGSSCTRGDAARKECFPNFSSLISPLSKRFFHEVVFQVPHTTLSTF